MTMPHTKVIDDEAKILSKFSSDLDNFRRYYSMYEDSEDKTYVRFIAPKIIAFENYRFLLLQNSVIKPLDPSKYYRPDYVSYDEYGTINLWALLLFINDIPTIEDFDVENILVPSKNIINYISKDILKKNLIEQLVPLHEYDPKPTVSLYSIRSAVPPPEEPVVDFNYIAQNIDVIKENFTLTPIMARERYVDLQEEPIKESAVLRIEGHGDYIYNKHYTIIKGSIKHNRLTWDPRKLDGSGLVSVLEEGMNFEVEYFRKKQHGI